MTWRGTYGMAACPHSTGTVRNGTVRYGFAIPYALGTDLRLKIVPRKAGKQTNGLLQPSQVPEHLLLITACVELNLKALSDLLPGGSSVCIIAATWYMQQ